MKKIIFLDIDGVLATPKCWGAGRKTWHDDFSYGWDKECVKLFNEIIEKTDCEIVFSSAWRVGYNHTRGNIKELFDHNGVNRVPFDVTPQKMSSHRSQEIRMWLETNGVPNRYCILDDDFIDTFPDNFIQCDSEVGITEEIRDIVIALLNSN